MKKIGEGSVPKNIPEYSSYYNYEWVKVKGGQYCYETGQVVKDKPESADKLWHPFCESAE